MYIYNTIGMKYDPLLKIPKEELQVGNHHCGSFIELVSQ